MTMAARLAPPLEAVPMDEGWLAAVAAIEGDLHPFPWTLGNFRDSLEAGYGCWVYETAPEHDHDHAQGPALVGYAVTMTAPDEVHLLNITVARAHQRRGFGDRILTHVAERGRASGAGRLILEVRPSNHAARSLYARRGFVQIGVRRGYYPAAGGREDAIVLALDLALELGPRESHA